jgi:elongation factor 3
MITAMKNPEECPAALEDLMHTTFIHPIDAATLSVIVPILERSLKSRGTMHEKRKAATVIINMCKLVLRPSFVEPFVPKVFDERETQIEIILR